MRKYKVCKKSGKPFKSGNVFNTIVSVTTNEQDPKHRPAYTFVEDDSVVNVESCSEPVCEDYEMFPDTKWNRFCSVTTRIMFDVSKRSYMTAYTKLYEFYHNAQVVNNTYPDEYTKESVNSWFRSMRSYIGRSEYAVQMDYELLYPTSFGETPTQFFSIESMRTFIDNALSPEQKKESLEELEKIRIRNKSKADEFLTWIDKMYNNPFSEVK